MTNKQWFHITAVSELLVQRNNLIVDVVVDISVKSILMDWLNETLHS